MEVYRFPKFAYLDDAEAVEQLAKMDEEVSEAMDAFILESNERFVEECLDAIHAIENMIRKVEPDEKKVGEIMDNVMEKNRERGYYG